jgi:hypothetical protein
MHYAAYSYTIQPIEDRYSRQHTAHTIHYAVYSYTIHPIGDRLREHGAVSLDGAEWFEKANLGVFTVHSSRCSQ